MLKDAQGFGLYEKGFDGSAEGLKGNFPMNFVSDEDAPLRVFERVAVMPEAVGSEALFVNERVAFLDCFDLGDPRDGEAWSELDFVNDDGTWIDGALGAACGREAEVVGGDFIEIKGV